MSAADAFEAAPRQQAMAMRTRRIETPIHREMNAGCSTSEGSGLYQLVGPRSTGWEAMSKLLSPIHWAGGVVIEAIGKPNGITADAGCPPQLHLGIGRIAAGDGWFASLADSELAGVRCRAQRSH